MMSNSTVIVLILLLWFLSAEFSICNGDTNVICSEKEKQALSSFKQGLTDRSNRLSSWSLIQDCCRWTGVRCDNVTGRVIGLNLSNPYVNDEYENEYELNEMFRLGGQITPSLLELEFLTYLNLSWNDFGGATIPTFLGSMPRLQYLNLQIAGFGGSIPHQLGNISTLRHLDLSRNQLLYVDSLSWIARLYSLEYLDMSGVDLDKAADWLQLGNISSLRYLKLRESRLHVDSLSWIARLHSLEYLDMTYIHLDKAADWLQAVSMLPSLLELHLYGCRLDKMIPPSGFANFTSLAVLDLSDNHFSGDIPSWLLNLNSSLLFLSLGGNLLNGHIQSHILNLHMLEILDLSDNHLTGQIPDSIGQLKHLESLDLSINSLYGPIPATLGNLSSLRSLSLSVNQLNGTLPESLGLLPNLVGLSIESNPLTGIVSEVNFVKLSKLKILEMSLSSLFFNVNSNWVPPFQLEYIGLSSCKMGKFPAWLQTQTSILVLYLSRSAISDSIPDWSWNMASHIQLINLSNNQIDGDLSNVLLNSTEIELSSNYFEGQLPIVSPNVKVLNIANNTFSGSISSFLCRKVNRNNNLEVLDVSSNFLSGELSDCWMYWQSLIHINLGSNNLSGKIPNSMGYLSELKSLHLHNNNFFGEISSSLQNCTSLGLIDFGENQLTGVIPSWIVERTTLMALRLNSNKFTGNIPPKICQLSSLLVLALANNNLSGTVPKCFNNISVMTVRDTSNFDQYFGALEYSYDYGSYMESLWLVTKGRDSEYRDMLVLVRSIDLSSNSLSGPIPAEISHLHKLHFLNLSHNQLMGKIPEEIGGMKMLESLDLSRNRLSGQIPQSMSNLTFLSNLDLSYNNFSGRIPSSTQLQSFGEASFIGNAELCGAPLTKNCTEEEQSQGAVPASEDGEEYEMFWFYIGLGPGFVVGFWGVCGVLFLKKTWRHAYFQFLDDMKDWIYVCTVLKVNWFRKKFERSTNV